VQMLRIAALVRADHAALEDRKAAFQGVGMYVAACPLELRMVNGFVIASRGFVVIRAIGDQPPECCGCGKSWQYRPAVRSLLTQ
jgi:hypothetical protein